MKALQTKAVSALNCKIFLTTTACAKTKARKKQTSNNIKAYSDLLQMTNELFFEIQMLFFKLALFFD